MSDGNRETLLNRKQPKPMSKNVMYVMMIVVVMGTSIGVGLVLMQNESNKPNMLLNAYGMYGSYSEVSRTSVFDRYVGV